MRNFAALKAKPRVEIFVLSPLKKYVDRSDPISGGFVDIEFSGMLPDELFNTVATDHLQRNFRAKVTDVESKINAVGNLTIMAPPNEFDLHLQVKDNRNEKLDFPKSLSGSAILTTKI